MFSSVAHHGSVWPLVSTVAFVLFFAGVVAWAFLRSRASNDHAANLVFDEQEHDHDR